MLHYKAVAKTPMQKLCDILLGTFGMGAMVFTTVQTIKVRSMSFALFVNLTLRTAYGYT